MLCCKKKAKIFTLNFSTLSSLFFLYFSQSYNKLTLKISGWMVVDDGIVEKHLSSF
jgi:hypothetical protein